MLVEVEAYHQDEPSCHAWGGRPTPRTEALFGAPGTCYVYFTYGMHWCMNLVTGAAGEGAAVLLRAAVPVHGLERMRERRSARRRPGAVELRDRDLCSGPAKLVQALGVEARHGGAGMLHDPRRSLDDAVAATIDGPPTIIADAECARLVGMTLPVGGSHIAVGPRIGISQARELPWRLGVAGSPYLSRPFASPVAPST